MLQIFKRELQSRNLQLATAEIVGEFELDSKSAIEADYTQVQIRGRFFHFTKSLLKKMKDLELFTH